MKNIYIVGLFNFFLIAVFGFLESLIGPLIPAIRNYFDVSYSSIGLMLLVVSIGNLSTSSTSGFAIERFGIKKVIYAGFLLIIASIAGMFVVKSFVLFLLLIFLISAGFGCFKVSANALATRICIRNAAVIMSLAHVMYGLGSTISARYAGTMLYSGKAWNQVYSYTLPLIAVGVVFLILVPIKKEKPSNQGSLQEGFKTMLKDQRIIYLALALGCFEVMQLGTTNWMVNFLQTSQSLNESQSSFYLSGFFIAFTIGRVIGGFIAEKFGYIKTLFAFSILFALSFMAGILFKGQANICFSIAGLFASIMFPTVIVMVMKEFKEKTASAISVVMSISVLINMSTNLIIGKVNDLMGVTIGYSLVPVYSVLALVVLVRLNKVLGVKEDNLEFRI